MFPQSLEVQSCKEGRRDGLGKGPPSPEGDKSFPRLIRFLGFLVAQSPETLCSPSLRGWDRSSRTQYLSSS